MTPSERLREALSLARSAKGRDGHDEEVLGNARALLSTVLKDLEQGEVKAPPEEVAAAVHRLQLAIWDACSQHPSEKPDQALKALMRDSEVVFAAALKSQVVETEDPCPLCDGKGRLPAEPLTREDKAPDSDDSWNAHTAANYRATYGKDPPSHLYNPGTSAGSPEALAALRRLVWMLPLVERSVVLCPPTEANPLDSTRMRLEAVPDPAQVLPPDACSACAGTGNARHGGYETAETDEGTEREIDALILEWESNMAEDTASGDLPDAAGMRKLDLILGALKFQRASRAKANEGSEVLPPDGTRDAVVTSARELLGQVRIPLGYRVVMVATDESGAFVGVHSNVDPDDTHAILVCALRGEDRQDYPA